MEKITIGYHLYVEFYYGNMWLLTEHTLSRNRILYITYGVIIALIIGSIFAQPALFPFGQKYQPLKLSIYGAFIILFSIVQFIFLRSINRINKMIKVNTLKLHITKIHRLVIISQIVLIGLLLAIFAQVLFNGSYDRSIICSNCMDNTYFDYNVVGNAPEALFSWFRHNREIGVLSFTIAIAIICVNLAFMLSYFTIESRDDPLYVTLFRGQTTQFSSPYNIYQQAYVLTYILSFVAIWCCYSNTSTSLLKEDWHNKILDYF